MSQNSTRSLLLCLAALLLDACGSGTAAPKIPINHRTSDVVCSPTVGPGNYACTDNCPTGSTYQCNSDADCAATGANARCLKALPYLGSFCAVDQCVASTDCAADQTCACRGSQYASSWGNACVPGNCRVDSDCGNNRYCSPSPQAATCDGNLAGYYCHTSADECTNDTDCSDGVCSYVKTAGRWQCLGPIFECA